MKLKENMLIYVTFAFVVPALFLVSVISYTARSAYQDQYANSLFSIATLASATVDTQFEIFVERAKLWSGNEVLQDLVVQYYDATGDRVSEQEALTTHLNGLITISDHEVHLLEIIDESGAVIASSDPSRIAEAALTPEDISKDYGGAFSGTDEVINTFVTMSMGSEAHHAEEGGQTHEHSSAGNSQQMVHTVANFNIKEGYLPVAFVVHHDLHRIATSINTSGVSYGENQPQQNANIFLLSAQDILLSNVGAGESLSSNPIKRCRDLGQSTAGEVYTNAEGVTVVGSIVCRTQDKWLIGVEVEKSVAFAGINKATMRGLVIFLLTAFIVVALSYILTGRIVSRVGFNLKVLRKIGSGDFRARVDVVGSDEIADVAEKINEMAEKLERYFGSVNEMYQKIFERAPLGIFVVDKEGKMQSFNPRLSSMLASDFHNVELIYDMNALSYKPFVSMGIDKEFKKVLINGVSSETEQYSDIFHKTFQFRAEPIFEKDGRAVQSMLVMVEDVSEAREIDEKREGHKKALESSVQKWTDETKMALEQAQEERMRAESYLDLVPLVVVVLDAKGGTRVVNKYGADLIGKSVEDIVGTDWFNVTAPERVRDEIRRGYLSLMAGDYDIMEGYESPINVVGDKEKLIRWSSALLYDEQGEIDGVLSAGRDITFETKARKKLNESGVLRDKFIRIISHQFRTPLNAIRWNLEALIGGDMGKLKPEHEEFLKVCHRADVEVISRIGDLLTVMGIQEGTVTLSKDNITMGRLVESVMGRAQSVCEVKGVDCVSEIDRVKTSELYVDTEKIRSAMNHLVQNGIEYTAEGGKVEVSLEQHAEHIRFVVKDNGVGIPKEEQVNVFDNFFRASNAHVMKQDASGLGLAISKFFVEAHGGEIGFESVEGEGSTFWFTLPIDA